MHLPDKLTTTLRQANVPGTEEWIARFPSLLDDCIHTWHLTDVLPVPDISVNYVATACAPNNRPVVLKIGTPITTIKTEIASLRLFGERWCARLLAVDDEKGAFLQERALPGHTLDSLNDNRQESFIAAGFMAGLPVPIPVSHAYPSLTEWAEVFYRIPERFGPECGGIPLKMTNKASIIAAELSASCREMKVLHADLHHGNILYDQNRGWVVIDPQSIIGDPAYECARFLHNPMPSFPVQPDPVAITRERISTISSMTGHDQQRIQGWAFVDCMFGACWSVEDNSGEAEYFLKCAEIIETAVNY